MIATVTYRSYHPQHGPNYVETSSHEIEDLDNIFSHVHGYFQIENKLGQVFLYPIANIINITAGEW